MKLFSSVSLDYQGRKCSGNFEAKDEESARNMLKAQGYHVVEIREVIRKNTGTKKDVFSRGRHDLPQGMKKHLTLALGMAMGIVALYLAVNIVRSGAFAPKSKMPGPPPAALVKTAVSKPEMNPPAKAAQAAPAPAAAAPAGSSEARDTVIGVLEDARDKGVINEKDFQDKKRGLETMK